MHENIFQIFLADIREKYTIDEIIADVGYLYYKIKIGIYGLKQAARLAFDAFREP